MSIFVFMVSWIVMTILLGALGVRSFQASVLLALTPAVMLAAWVRLKRGTSGDGGYSIPGIASFSATYASENLALDLAERRLWLRDVQGRTMIVDLDQIAAWQHTWTETSNAWGRHFRIRNEIAFRFRHLDHPAATVRFRRHNDALFGNENFQEAATWQARLTSLLNE